MTAPPISPTATALGRLREILRIGLAGYCGWRPGVERNGLIFGSSGPFIDVAPCRTQLPYAVLRANSPALGMLMVFAAERAMAIDLAAAASRAIDAEPGFIAGSQLPPVRLDTPVDAGLGPEVWQVDVPLGWSEDAGS